MGEEQRWEKLKAGLYDAIYGKGLDQPYLDATARLLDVLRVDYDRLRAKAEEMEADKERYLFLVENCYFVACWEDDSLWRVYEASLTPTMLTTEGFDTPEHAINAARTPKPEEQEG